MNYLMISVASALVTLSLCERFIIRYYHRAHEALLRKKIDLYNQLGEKVERNMELRVELYEKSRELAHLKEENKRLREELSLHQKQEESLHKELMEQVERQNH